MCLVFWQQGRCTLAATFQKLVEIVFNKNIYTFDFHMQQVRSLLSEKNRFCYGPNFDIVCFISYFRILKKIGENPAYFSIAAALVHKETSSDRRQESAQTFMSRRKWNGRGTSTAVVKKIEISLLEILPGRMIRVY